MIVHILGGLIVVTGLVLFVLDQRASTGVHEEAALRAWKIELGGPASLVLIVVGIFVFLFPYSPWWPETSPPATTTTTTVVVIDDPPITAPPESVPTALEWWVEYNDDCQDDAIHWLPGDDNWAYFQVWVWLREYDMILEEGYIETPAPYLCFWEFVTGGPALFDFEIWAVGGNYDPFYIIDFGL